ncbi:BatA domain-containing protein [candidate division WOR-3 bacterium]|nr:BatA domain-containing protein [candidate division WOR-3 bacterium]
MMFQSPWFLLGTALAAVPVLIHLWYRRRLRKMAFPTLRFLRASEAQRFGWLRLRELLILTARCLFIIFLFLGLARPVLKSRLFAIGRLSSVYLVLDNSYSMAYGDNFKRMKKLAQQVVARYSSDSEFLIVPLCSERDRVLGTWKTKNDALDSVERLRLTYRGGSIAKSLASEPSREAKHEIDYVYVGDGQAVNFRDFPVESADNGKGNYYWVQVSTGTNIGISAVALKDPVTVAQDEYTLQITLSSYSSRTWSGRIGVASGEHYSERECRLEPFAEGSFDLDLPAQSLTGEVRIFDDSLLVDNVYYFCKVLPKKIGVLLVGDSPYLKHVLTSGTAISGSFDVQAAEALGAADLRKHDVIVLNGLLEISESELIRLADFQRRPGTGLIVVLAGGAGANLRESVSGSCLLGEAVLPKGYVTLEWIAHDHPVFAIFGESGALQDVQCYGYLRIEAEKGVLARLSGGDPFLVVRDNLAVFSTPLTPQHTNFVHSRAFVPVMLRLMVNLVTRQQRKEYRVGEVVTLPGTVRTPAGELLHPGDQLSMPGFHFHDGETLAVNVLPEEGDLRVMGPERARVLGVSGIDPQRDLAGSDLSNLFLVLALVLILVELALLWLR